MRYINGGLVTSVPMSYEYELLPDRAMSSNLMKNVTRNFYHLFDRMVMVNPDLKEIMDFVRDKVSVNWYRTLRGRVINLMLVRFMVFQMYPQRYNHQSDLILYANYSIIKHYIQRTVKVLIKCYGLPDRYYKLKIPKEKLYTLSKLWANDMFDTSVKMVTHYHKLMAKKSLSTVA